LGVSTRVLSEKGERRLAPYTDDDDAKTSRVSLCARTASSSSRKHCTLARA
jgi:hypothetical protein